MSGQVRYRCGENGGILSELPKTGIATSTQQRSGFPSSVAVVDMGTVCHFSVGRKRQNRFANRTTSTLRIVHCLQAIFGQSVLSFEATPSERRLVFLRIFSTQPFRSSTRIIADVLAVRVPPRLVALARALLATKGGAAFAVRRPVELIEWLAGAA